MNILFYVDPIIERGKPKFKDGWANYFSLNLIKTITNYDYDKSSKPVIYIVLNEPLAQLFEGREYVQNVVVVSQKELLKVFEWDSFEAEIAWQKGEYSKLQLEYYCTLYRNKLGNFVPDVIITLSNVPFFRELYPNALILHEEYGVFSRKPFPETWYFDIYGMQGVTYLNKNWGDIQNKFRLEPDKIEILSKFKKKITEGIRGKSPFDKIMSKYLIKFKHLVLLPVYPSESFVFSSLSSFNNTYQFLIYMLENIPSNIGIVVTTHPEYNFLTHDLVNYLRDTYSNFIYEFEFEEVYAPSQYLMSYVDAVITLSTSLALQTLLWGKKFITYNKDYMKFVSDASDINNLEHVLKQKNKNKDDILFWILTRYCISKRYLDDPVWLNKFLTTSLKKFRNNEIHSSFYDLIDDESKVIESLLQDCDWNIPNLSTNYSYERLYSLYYKANTDYNNLKEKVSQISTRSAMLGIIKDNEQILMEKINKSIKGDFIYIWGAGTHTELLIKFLRKYNFDICKIKGIIDSNIEKVITKKFLNGIPLVYKENFFESKSKLCSDIIISSASYEDDIYDEISCRISTRINIIRLYDNADFKVLI